MKHTPGPWYVDNSGTIICKDIGDCSYSICGLDDWSEDTIHNARLIAAAPELLEALERIIMEKDDWNGPYEGAIEQAKQAVAKARGE